MSQIVWRIATDSKTYAADDLSGLGAKHTGGRWNEPGLAALYTSQSQALACLETLVHLNAGGLPFNRYLVAITIPEAVWAEARRETKDTLPVGWDAQPAGITSIQFGSAWLKAGAQAVLVVPSAIVTEEFNVLINPAHAGSGGIRAEKRGKFFYDPRLGR